jgi:hypothetical protein
MLLLWAACKVLLSGMQIFENYAFFNTACCMTPVLLAANAADCMSHAPNIFL